MRNHSFQAYKPWHSFLSACLVVTCLVPWRSLVVTLSDQLYDCSNYGTLFQVVRGYT